MPDSIDGTIEKLEFASEMADFDVKEMLEGYRKLHGKPIWRLVEDIQQQAMMYTNIVEQIKSGQTAPDIRTRFESLGLGALELIAKPEHARAIAKSA